MEPVDKTTDVTLNNVEQKPAQKHVNTTNLPDNSKPHFMMRIAGGLIDLCCLVLAIFGLFYLLTLSPMGNGLRENKEAMVFIQDKYKVTELVEGSGETYGHKVYENDPTYGLYTTYLVHEADESGYKYVVIDNETISDEVIAAYKAAVKADETYKNCAFDYNLIQYGITCLAGFISMGIFLLMVPLLNKRRATLGKLFAGTQLINSKYFVPAKWYQVLGRFLFQFVVEGAIPYLFLTGVTIILPILLIPGVLFIITLIDRKNGRTLHDFVSVTKVIDKRTFIPLSEQQVLYYI